MDPSLNVGLSMLGTTTTLSAVMGVTLTMAIGGECGLRGMGYSVIYYYYYFIFIYLFIFLLLCV